MTELDDFAFRVAAQHIKYMRHLGDSTIDIVSGFGGMPEAASSWDRATRFIARQWLSLKDVHI